jgi:Tetracyclin repressor-like, C-terminal domain
MQVAHWFAPGGPYAPDQVADAYAQLALRMAGHITSDTESRPDQEQADHSGEDRDERRDDERCQLARERRSARGGQIDAPSWRDARSFPSRRTVILGSTLIRPVGSPRRTRVTGDVARRA